MNGELAMSSERGPVEFDRTDPDWWKSAVFYQIYPRSFADSNGDGIGDLAGITERVPYIAALGVDALWISPIFTSPMHDFGYDVADYCDIDPVFGTLADADELIARCHEYGLRITLDWVPNHTSNEHAWFVESRAMSATWEPEKMRSTIDAIQNDAASGTQPTWVLSNHDQPRHRTRYGNDERARAAAFLSLGQRSTPYLYAGEELGLGDATIPPDAVVDPGGRDGCRAPIPWSAAALHGWGPAPWLPFVDDAVMIEHR